MGAFMQTGRTKVVAVTGLLACASLAMAGPDWTEVGDAGSGPGNAQVTLGNGVINSISGTLGNRGSITDFEDMYYIGVDEPGAFSLVIANADFDAQLFVFHLTLSGAALGLLANDNADVETTLPAITPMATDGTGVVLDLPGVYLIAVAGAGRRPVSMTGDIFSYDSSTEISGADGPGGLNRLIGWEGEGETGSYNIRTDGTVFPEIPAPGTLALLSVAGLATRRRR
jgi:hypothetical protein